MVFPHPQAFVPGSCLISKPWGPYPAVHMLAPQPHPYSKSRWEFPKIRGTFWPFGGPYNRDYNVCGSMLGPPIEGNYHYSLALRF